MKYPGGIKRQSISRKPSQSNGTINSMVNRGMSLEEDINITNQYYLDHQIGVIHKKPTPIQIVNVDYETRSAALITECFFPKSSTTEYNGINKGKHIDFEVISRVNKIL